MKTIIKEKPFIKKMLESHHNKTLLRMKLGVTGPVIYGWFKGNNVMPRYTKEICEMFACEFDDIFEIVED